MGSRHKDVTGQKFGLLTAISIAGKDNYGRNKWLFSCECGTETIASLNNVLTGGTKSCGCLLHKPKRIDLKGSKFGNLSVISYSQTKNGKAYWNCLCDCGTTTEVSYIKLIRGRKKSCGCLRYKKDGLNLEYKWVKDLKKMYTECVKCSTTEQLHVHHIYPYSQNEEKRWLLSNGIVFCKKCHMDFHKIYGKKHIGLKELGEFLNLTDLAIETLILIDGHKTKNGAEDVKKVIHYCQLILELEYGIKNDKA